MDNYSVIQLWERYRKNAANVPESYDVWAFGDSKEMADELAKLVTDGIKTATSSNYIVYKEENEPLPYAGLHNVILDGDGNAAAIIETTFVDIVPFEKVSEGHAFMEGEGDRTLTYWREVHESFFKKELREMNRAFHFKIPVVCERFKLVFTNKE
ncbi:MAG TPA: ASCH domain-containing protein [Pseudogracilibacillus sp.]|nr:ASCH domain-containing protein [Pseudogracilibacillus sp.]